MFKHEWTIDDYQYAFGACQLPNLRINLACNHFSGQLE